MNVPYDRATARATWSFDRGYADGYRAVRYAWPHQIEDLANRVHTAGDPAGYRAGFLHGHADAMACYAPSGQHVNYHDYEWWDFR